MPLRVLRTAEREHRVPGERFVGREHELAQLEHALDSVVAGHGRMFLVSGEPGIGKTRLANEFSARAAARGLRVMWGRSWEGAGAPAYWPIIQIIRACAERPDFAQLTEALGAGIEQVAALVPELIQPAPSHGERADAGRIDPEQARFRLFDAVATLLKGVAHREPLVIVIDDLHDADLGAIQMVRFIARALKDAPVVLLGTHREAEVERSPELRAVFAELLRESEQMPLRGLSLSDAAEMVRVRSGGMAPDAGFLATLHRTTGGNPLFLSGVVQMLVAEGKLENLASVTAADLKLPTDVRGAIAHQLSGLSEPTNAVLAVASALGIEFELAPLERVAARPTAEILDRLHEAAAAGIVASVETSRGHWRFAHALIRAAIYGSMGSKERIELHRRIADTLEDIYASDIDSHLSELAHHYIEATATGTAEKAIDCSIRAGNAALDVLAHEETLFHWQTANALIKNHGGSQQRHAQLLGKLGALLQENDSRSGIEVLESAVSLYEKLDMSYEAASVRQKLGLVLASPGERMDTERALLHLRAAEAVLGGGPDTPFLASLYVGLGLVSRNRCHVRDAQAAMERAMVVAERAGDEGAWGMAATSVASYLLQTGRLSESRVIAEIVWRRLPKISHRFFGALWTGGGCWAQLWDHAKAIEWWRRGLENPNLTNFQNQVLGQHLEHASLRTGDLVSPWRAFGKRGLAAFFRDGDWQSSLVFFQKELDEYRRTYGRDNILNATRDLALARRMLDEPAAAAALLEGILADYPTDEPHLQIEMHLRPDLTFLYLELGAYETAREQVARCEEILAVGEDWRGLGGHATHALAAYAAAQKDYTLADDRFSAVTKFFESLSLVWQQADAFRNWGNALLSAGDSRRATEKFDAAIEIYRRIGTGQPWIDRVMVDRARAVSAAKASSERAADRNVFRKQGEYWALSFGGAECNMKDAKGLHYIEHLLRNPGEQISAIDLVAWVASNVSGASQRTVNLGDAGEILDAKARADYKRRLDELREDIDRGRKMNDFGMTERAEAEYDALLRQLGAASGLGGRERHAASHRERARVTVAKRIKAVVDRIRLSNPVLERHLADSIRTGNFCCYSPSAPTSWRF